MSEDVIEQLKSSLLDLDRDNAVAKAHLVLEAAGKIPVKAAVDAVADGLQIVGDRFQTGEWYLAELIYAGEIAKEVLTLLSPMMEAGGASTSLGTIVVGTVARDLHDLGKNIFINYARSAGFKVIDLGVDVSVDTFIKAVKEHQPLALGMSCLLTSTEKELGKVIAETERQNLRSSVKIIIGGACLTETLATEIGADAFAPDAITGLNIVKRWAGAS